jgi:hypothetical protein
VELGKARHDHLLAVATRAPNRRHLLRQHHVIKERRAGTVQPVGREQAPVNLIRRCIPRFVGDRDGRLGGKRRRGSLSLPVKVETSIKVPSVIVRRLIPARLFFLQRFIPAGLFLLVRLVS